MYYGLFFILDGVRDSYPWVISFLLWNLDLNTWNIIRIALYSLESGARGEVIRMAKIQSGGNTSEHRFQNRNYQWKIKWGQWKELHMEMHRNPQLQCLQI